MRSDPMSWRPLKKSQRLTVYAVMRHQIDRPVGTNARSKQVVSTKAKPKAEFRCRGSTPDFLREGPRSMIFMRPDRVLWTQNGERAEPSDEGYLTARCHYANLIHATDLESAEIDQICCQWHFWRPKITFITKSRAL